MNDMTQCTSCGDEAIARVDSDWLCARCGLGHTAVTSSAGAGNTRWKGAVRAAIGSGLAAKVLIGAAAVAAVGGAVAADTPPDPDSTPPVSTPVGPPETPVAQLPPNADPLGGEPAGLEGNGVPAPDADGIPDEVAEYLAAVFEWTECIDTAIHDFVSDRPGRGGFKPFAECGERPDPQAYGLGRRPEWAGKPVDPGSRADVAPGRTGSPGSSGGNRP